MRPLHTKFRVLAGKLCPASMQVTSLRYVPLRRVVCRTCGGMHGHVENLGQVLIRRHNAPRR